MTYKDDVFLQHRYYKDYKEADQNTDNALKCSKSKKQIKNNSVYCTLLDQWVAVNYCAYVCKAPELKK